MSGRLRLTARSPRSRLESDTIRGERAADAPPAATGARRYDDFSLALSHSWHRRDNIAVWRHVPRDYIEIRGTTIISPRFSRSWRRPLSETRDWSANGSKVWVLCTHEGFLQFVCVQVTITNDEVQARRIIFFRPDVRQYNGTVQKCILFFLCNWGQTSRRIAWW